MGDWTRRQAGKPWSAGTIPDLAHAVVRRSKIHSLSCCVHSLGIRFVGNHVPRGLMGNFFKQYKSQPRSRSCARQERAHDPERKLRGKALQEEALYRTPAPQGSPKDPFEGALKILRSPKGALKGWQDKVRLPAMAGGDLHRGWASTFPGF